MIRFQRIAAGYYTATVNGRLIEISKVEGERSAWYWLIDGAGGDDWFPSKAEAIAAVIAWIGR